MTGPWPTSERPTPTTEARPRRARAADFPGSWNVYRWLQRLFRLYFVHLIHLDVVGLSELPQGPLILCGNHQSALDPLLISTVVPDPVVHLTKAELFRRWPLRFALIHLGCIPVHRQRGDHSAIKQALEQLRRGQILVIFPEGTRRHGGSGPLHEGAAFLALHGGATLQSFKIQGSYHRDRLRLVFGPALKPSIDMTRHDVTQWLARQVSAGWAPTAPAERDY